jgi:Protein of unknown function (DUF2849)
MIIANRLLDGRTVFLSRDGEWVRSIEAGALLEESESSEFHAQAKEHEARCLVVDPNLIDVSTEGERPRPTAMREVIRAFGPTPAADSESAG